MKRTVLSAIALLGLAVFIHASEPEHAATEAVSGDDLQLVSEETVSEEGPAFGRNGNTGKNGRGSRGRRSKSSDFTDFTMLDAIGI